MNCTDFRDNMNDFIHNQIDENKVEAFIEHYRNCKNCNEELEIQYMINKTFSDDKPSSNTVSLTQSFDFKKRLNQKIAYYEELVYHNYKVNFLMRLLIGITESVAVAVAIYFIISVFGGNNV